MKIIFEDENHLMPDGTMWHLTVYDSMILDLDGQLVNTHSLVRVPTPEEVEQAKLENEKQSRITELKEMITNKKLLDIECLDEKNELKILLGL